MSISPMGTLTGVESPPFSLPGSHFAVGLVFFVGGALALFAAAPYLAVGSYLSPQVTAATHFFTLGWITTSIMGALYQLFPVVLTKQVRWPRLAGVTLWVYAPGLAVFVAGLFAGAPAITVVGAAALAVGILLFLTNLAGTLASVEKRDVTWWALTAAGSFLFLIMVVGAALAYNLRWPFMEEVRLAALGTHIHVALVGWVLLVMVGVGQRLLPMFLLSHGADERPGRMAVALLSSGALLLVALHHTPGTWARWLPAALILLGVAAFLAQARAFFRTSKRPSLDPGMRMAGAALGILALGAAMGLGLRVQGFTDPRLATAYVALLVLGISSFVAAHYYKILPFLVWYHRFGPLAGKQPVPRVADLFSARWAGAVGVLLIGGALLLSGSIAWGSVTGVRAGAVCLAVGASIEALQMWAVSRRRPE